jgi:hypothetical protein
VGIKTSALLDLIDSTSERYSEFHPQQTTFTMKLISALVILLPLSVSASSLPSVISKRQGPLPDCLGDGGPSLDAKNAVRDFARKDAFADGTEQYCAPTCGNIGGKQNPFPLDTMDPAE